MDKKLKTVVPTHRNIKIQYKFIFAIIDIRVSLSENHFSSRLLLTINTILIFYGTDLIKSIYFDQQVTYAVSQKLGMHF
jgi:hypothetical protein